uniref:Fe_hyd_lg_C domain-containing protein n=1 Tax=Trichuris muris TaxID=70415 RepID=A0A5S6QH21_TRIMR
MAAKGVVRLTDLDDFIAPSQVCIKPIAVESRTSKAKVISYEGEDIYEEVDEFGRKKALKPVSITLNDCLACSGCITSSEAVLIEKQGPDELLHFIERAKSDSSRWLLVVTVSPQSIASIASRYELTMEKADGCIRQFFKMLGMDFVFGSTFARNLSLISSAMEFVDRYRAWQTDRSCTRIFPMISGICPGWVCYAEKSVGDIVIPLICKARSPQAITGAFVKDYLLQMLRELKCPYVEDLHDSRIYHATVMPCFDKKLEASRSCFVSSSNAKEVDLVLSTGQLAELIERMCPHFKDLQEDNEPEWSPLMSPLYRHSGSGSGGYLDFIFKKTMTCKKSTSTSMVSAC